MLIALLAVLGVDLIVIVVLAAGMFSRRRWVSRQPGAFKGAIRVVDGELPGLGRKWKRGYGRWVRGVFVWTKAPLLVRNEPVAVDGLAGEVRTGEAGEVKHLGSEPVIVPVAADGAARIEVAAPADCREHALGPFAASTPLASGTRDGPAPVLQAVKLPGVAGESSPGGRHAPASPPDRTGPGQTAAGNGPPRDIPASPPVG